MDKNMNQLPFHQVVAGLCIERECVRRNCNHDCAHCDLAQEREWLLDVYDNAIKILWEKWEQDNAKSER